MTQDELKTLVAHKALDYVVDGAILGVGSGSTVNKFIAALPSCNKKVLKAVSSSNKTTELLQQVGIEVISPNECEGFDIYIDGADEIDKNFNMIKGGGACLTREKILASMAKTFVCIVDESKLVDTLGKFALPVEVIPMARNKVARELEKLGGKATLRQGCITDNNCEILDVAGLYIHSPLDLEQRINQIPGVVTVGLFAKRNADILLYANEQGVKELRKSV